ADHGGGNNSTFTNVVISSTGTDLYSTIAGSIGSLKGPRHGGANLAVRQQMKAVIDEIGLNASDDKIKEIVCRILDKDFNDKSGLIYGIGHAVYTLSDPRSEILSIKCEELSYSKNRHEEFVFHQRFAEIAKEEIYKRKGKRVCTNVDFYSGLVYDLLGIPEDLYTLLFVIGRTVGWVAHNLEDKLYGGRIIRPATKYVGHIKSCEDEDGR
ncbi:citrate/2-methylcitrate synthase, partial [Kandleria vitulina]